MNGSSLVRSPKELPHPVPPHEDSTNWYPLNQKDAKSTVFLILTLLFLSCVRKFCYSRPMEWQWSHKLPWLLPEVLSLQNMIGTALGDIKANWAIIPDSKQQNSKRSHSCVFSWLSPNTPTSLSDCPSRAPQCQDSMALNRHPHTHLVRTLPPKSLTGS